MYTKSEIAKSLCGYPAALNVKETAQILRVSTMTVYKLIMKDTLEEKILKLQEQKARLSDEIISEGSIKDALATREELLEILK